MFLNKYFNEYLSTASSQCLKYSPTEKLHYPQIRSWRRRMTSPSADRCHMTDIFDFRDRQSISERSETNIYLRLPALQNAFFHIEIAFFNWCSHYELAVYISALK